MIKKTIHLLKLSLIMLFTSVMGVKATNTTLVLNGKYECANVDRTFIAHSANDDTLYLIVWTKNGERIGYVLDKEPVISFTENEMKIKGNDFDVIYTLDNFARYTYDIHDPATIRDILTEKFIAKFEGESIVFPSLKAHSTVSVYTLNGVQIFKKTVQKDGEYAFPLSVLSSGVYLVNINGQTYKIMKK